MLRPSVTVGSGIIIRQGPGTPTVPGFLGTPHMSMIRGPITGKGNGRISQFYSGLT